MPSTKEFHATIHARPVTVQPGESIDIGGLTLATLDISSNQLDTLFSVTFEQVLESLETFPRMLCELDGSFVWSGECDDQRWQVDGHLYDRNEHLLYVEIKGRCPSEKLDQLLHTLGWSTTAVIFQLISEAVVIEEAEFRRYIRTSTDSADGR